MVTAAKYLVDTDWAVYYLRGKEPYVARLRYLQQQGLSISVISVAELYEGVYRAPNPEAKEEGLKQFLAGMAVADFTSGTARTFGRLRAEMRQKGETVADLDLLIASTAVYHGLTLITDNRRHYDRIPGIRLLYEE